MASVSAMMEPTSTEQSAEAALSDAKLAKVIKQTAV
jgi:hypothetical protein